jgi:hypothetical protein
MTSRELGFLIGGAGVSAGIAAILLWLLKRKKNRFEEEDRPPIIVSNGSVKFSINTKESKDNEDEDECDCAPKEWSEPGEFQRVETTNTYEHRHGNEADVYRLIVKIRGSNNADGRYRLPPGDPVTLVVRDKSDQDSKVEVRPADYLKLTFDNTPTSMNGELTLHAVRLVKAKFAFRKPNGGSEYVTCNFDEKAAARIEIRSRKKRNL